MGEKTKVLITGASGFVGSAIAEVLQKSGRHEIFCLRGRRSPSGNNIDPNSFFGDVGDYESIKHVERLENIDALIHCAGLAHQFGKVDRGDFWRANVDGTKNICRLANNLRAKKVLLISSVAVYGDHANSDVDESFACRPAGFYAESKLESERAAGEICKATSLIILRPSTVVGEGDIGNTQRLIKAIESGWFLKIGHGFNKKSLIYRNDVAEAVKIALETDTKKSFEIYNLSAKAIEMREVVKVIYQNLGKPEPRLQMSEKFFEGIFRLNDKTLASGTLKKYENTFRKWISDDIYSSEKFEKTFGFKNEVSADEAIARQVKFYLANKNA